MSLGLRDGAVEGVGLEQGGREEAGMVWQMCIQIYHASSVSEWFERESGERSTWVI